MRGSRLNDSAVALATGSLPQNVNYAIKIDYLIPLLRSVEGFADQLAKETYPSEVSIGQCLESSTYLILCQLNAK